MTNQLKAGLEGNIFPIFSSNKTGATESAGAEMLALKRIIGDDNDMKRIIAYLAAISLVLKLSGCSAGKPGYSGGNTVSNNREKP